MALNVVQWLSLVGFLLSVYFLYVKFRSGKDKNYKPICDFSDTISCSKAATSKYSTLHVIPTSILGLIFYPLVFALAQYSMFEYIFYLAIATTAFLIYQIYNSFRIKVACPVCIAIYIVHIGIIYFSYLAL